jgi:hypothetical protein
MCTASLVDSCKAKQDFTAILYETVWLARRFHDLGPSSLKNLLSNFDTIRTLVVSLPRDDHYTRFKFLSLADQFPPSQIRCIAFTADSYIDEEVLEYLLKKLLLRHSKVRHVIVPAADQGRIANPTSLSDMRTMKKIEDAEQRRR